MRKSEDNRSRRNFLKSAGGVPIALAGLQNIRINYAEFASRKQPEAIFKR